MKKIITALLIIAAMYVTAKWPNQVVSVTEFGYRLVRSAVSTGVEVVQEMREGNGAEEGGMQIDGTEL